jgi:hypothetical protein
MLGRLRMEVDNCIAAYSSLMSATYNVALNQAASETIEESVQYIVAVNGGSNTEAFC